MAGNHNAHPARENVDRNLITRAEPLDGSPSQQEIILDVGSVLAAMLGIAATVSALLAMAGIG